MTTFFTALNPCSHKSGIPLRTVWKGSRENHFIRDLSLGNIIPFLWDQDLSVIDGIYHTFWVLYGDHFDEQYGLGIGRKGVLDYTVLPLIGRFLKSYVLLHSDEESGFLDALALVFASTIRSLYFGIALLFTLVLTPVVVLVTMCRAIVNWLVADHTERPQQETFQQPRLEVPTKAKPISMSMPEAMAAFLQLLDLDNIDPTAFPNKDCLALVYIFRSLPCSIRGGENFSLAIQHVENLSTAEVIIHINERFLNNQLITQEEFKCYCRGEIPPAPGKCGQTSYGITLTSPSSAALSLFALIRQEKKAFKSGPLVEASFNRYWSSISPKLIEKIEAVYADIYPRQTDGSPHPKLHSLLEMGRIDMLNDPLFVSQKSLWDRVLPIPKPSPEF